jgi:hypothetical protein
MVELCFQNKTQEDMHAGKASQRKTVLQDNRAQPSQAMVLVDGRSAPVQMAQKTNNTGLPNQLKSGIEALSGLSMDHVKVHYNSSKPAQLNAYAYAQGRDIHLAPGQEKHLPHEAWHVVQQAQGRVNPTMQLKEGPVNNDQSLETEADVMAVKATSIGIAQAKQEQDGFRERYYDSHITQFAGLNLFKAAPTSDPEQGSGVVQMVIAQTFSAWLAANAHAAMTAALLDQYYQALVAPEYVTARNDCWKIRFLDDSTPRALGRFNNLAAYHADYQQRYNSAVAHPFANNNQLAVTAVNDLVTYINDTQAIIATVTPQVKARYYVRLAHDVVESVHANPTAATAGRAAGDPGHALLNHYIAQIANINVLYQAAIAGAVGGIGHFNVKGVAFDAHTGANNYISAAGQNHEQYPGRPLTPIRYRNITAALLDPANDLWGAYNHRELAIYLAAVIAEPARYGPAAMTNLISAGKAASYRDAGVASIFTQLTMTTGGTDPAANPTHAALVGRAGMVVPATTATADREKDLIFGNDPDWMEATYLNDLNNTRAVVLNALIETQHNHIQNFVDNPQGE